MIYYTPVTGIPSRDAVDAGKLGCIITPDNVRFCVAPDVFDANGGECHSATLERWKYYGPLIERHGYTPAFVCQVGSTPDNVPDEAEVLFIGGTTDWKLGSEARAIVEKHRDTKWIHMGRVNSYKRFKYAHQIGCDSTDGTVLVYAPTENLERIFKWQRKLKEQNPPLLKKLGEEE
jgi:hypothetical protein